MVSLTLPGLLPPSVDVAQGTLATAVACLLGGGLALVFSKSGIESKCGVEPRLRARRQPLPATFDKRRVERARRAGELDKAQALLKAEVGCSPRNRDVVMAFWDVSVELGQAREATPAVFRLIREELRRGAMEVAASHWGWVADQMTDARLDPKTLASLLPWIEKAGSADKTVLALEQVFFEEKEAKEVLAATVVADLACMAVEIAPDIAEKAARMALCAGGLADERRAQLQELLGRLAPLREEPPSFQAPRGELPENAFYAEQDRSEFGEITDLAGLLPDEMDALPVSPDGAPISFFPGVRPMSALPVSLEPDALLLEVAGRGQARLAYSRICGVTIAGVRGVGSRPVVLVDLLLTGPEPEGLTLEVVRLQGDQFDPRHLVDGFSSPIDALKVFVGELLGRSGAAALPSADIVDAATRVEIYDSLDDYQTRVLRVARQSVTS